MYELIIYVSPSRVLQSINNNNNRLFMALHLVRVQSAYKHIKIRSFHYTRDGLDWKASDASAE